jgi:hypothetical protein
MIFYLELFITFILARSLIPWKYQVPLKYCQNDRSVINIAFLLVHGPVSSEMLEWVTIKIEINRHFVTVVDEEWPAGRQGTLRNFKHNDQLVWNWPKDIKSSSDVFSTKWYRPPPEELNRHWLIGIVCYTIRNVYGEHVNKTSRSLLIGLQAREVSVVVHIMLVFTVTVY